MTNAVIVSTARTPLAKSWKGAFNMTHGATLGGHAVQHAVARAGIDGAEVDDVIMGCANPEGATGANIARQIALRAGLPITTSGVTVNRFCSSGLQTIAMAAQRIIAGEGDVYVAGGVESISCVQQEMNTHMLADPWLVANKPEIYWNMLQTAEQVAKRYNISRDAMDEYGAASQQKATAALEAGLFKAEIAPITVTAGVADKVMGLTTKKVTVENDEGIRAGTTFEGIHGLRSALPGGLVSAGNASQFSDGGGACVLMNETMALFTLTAGDAAHATAAFEAAKAEAPKAEAERPASIRSNRTPDAKITAGPTRSPAAAPARHSGSLAVKPAPEADDWEDF